MSDYDVCVIGGAGHVGLPFALLLADAGRRVVCYDRDEHAVATLAQGNMPFLEEGAEPILKRVLGKTLTLTTEARVVADSHYLVVVIGTPVDEHLNPKFTVFKRLFDDLMPLIGDHHHILLRSTVYPGTTEKIHDYLHSQGKAPRVSFCPERIAQGKAIAELRELPQIISACDAQGLQEARELFASVTGEILELEPMEAELAKLFTNSWRYIQFSIANQFYQIATEHGQDFYRILNAITYHYPRAQGLPGAGFAAGPCLFKDTMQVAAFSNNSFFLGHAAMLVNEGLPNFIVTQLQRKHDLARQTVGILGMAFKPNIDDKRQSLSYKLRKILEVEARQVLCSDEYFREEGFVDAPTLIAQSDIVILAIPHRQYADLAIPEDKPVVDVWNYLRRGGLFS